MCNDHGSVRVLLFQRLGQGRGVGKHLASAVDDDGVCFPEKEIMGSRCRVVLLRRKLLRIQNPHSSPPLAQRLSTGEAGEWNDSSGEGARGAEMNEGDVGVYDWLYPPG